MPGWLGMGKPVDISFSFCRSCIQRSYILRFPAFCFAFFPGVFLGYTKDRLWGWEIIWGKSHFLEIRQPHLFPAINISHIFGWFQLCSFLCPTAYWFSDFASGRGGWGWGLDTIINGLLFFFRLSIYLLLVDFVVDLLFQIPCSYIILFLTSFFAVR